MGHYETKSWNRQMVYRATLLGIKVECMERLQEQLTGLVIFCFTLFLTLSVPVSYQQPTSPYITHTKYDIW